MISPVVQSHFGSRPLLEVPAMQVASTGDIAAATLVVPGAQPAPVAPPAAAAPAARAVLALPTVPVVAAAPAAVAPAGQAATLVPGAMAVAPNAAAAASLFNPFPGAANPMVGPGLFNMQPAPFPAGGFPAPQQQAFPGFEGRHHSAPAGPQYNAQGRPYYYGPNGEIIFPPPVYPGVANSFAGAVPNANTHPQGFNPFHGPPGRMPYPPFDPASFNVTCELEFGRITHIDLRESSGSFRGIPDFIRVELLRTYGSAPHTEVKIKFESGEFHIYVNNEKRHKKKRSKSRESNYSDADSLSDTEYGLTDVDSYAPIKPRQRGEKPRRVVHEKGWNRFR